MHQAVEAGVSGQPRRVAAMADVAAFAPEVEAAAQAWRRRYHGEEDGGEEEGEEEGEQGEEGEEGEEEEEEGEDGEEGVEEGEEEGEEEGKEEGEEEEGEEEGEESGAAPSDLCFSLDEVPRIVPSHSAIT